MLIYRESHDIKSQLMEDSQGYCVTETHLNTDIDDSEIYISDTREELKFLFKFE